MRRVLLRFNISKCILRRIEYLSNRMKYENHFFQDAKYQALIAVVPIVAYKDCIRINYGNRGHSGNFRTCVYFYPEFD